MMRLLNKFDKADAFIRRNYPTEGDQQMLGGLVWRQRSIAVAIGVVVAALYITIVWLAWRLIT